MRTVLLVALGILLLFSPIAPVGAVLLLVTLFLLPVQHNFDTALADGDVQSAGCWVVWATTLVLGAFLIGYLLTAPALGS